MTRLKDTLNSWITNDRVSGIVMWVCVGAVIVAGVDRYLRAPSFWLDEAFVAVSLRNPTAHSIFAPLLYGQYFPRVYLLAIAGVREVAGYQVWALRLLPTLCFIAGTVLWGRLLKNRAGAHTLLVLLGGLLLVGSSFWLDQSTQLKQYTLDVFAALIPFSIDDRIFEDALIRDKRKYRLALLAIPCLVSYTYPLSLVARTVGWFLQYIRSRGRSLRPAAALLFVLSVAAPVIVIFFTDLRFNLANEDSYLNYWHGSILSRRFEQGFLSGLSLIGNFIWGWQHGRFMPIAVAAIAPLQAIGVYRVITRWKNSDSVEQEGRNSVALGSLLLLVGAILASLFLSYPIASGRLVLFTQVHTQVLAIEGGLVVVGAARARKGVIFPFYIAITILTVYSVHRYLDFVRTEPPENIRPMLQFLNRNAANVVYVHPCSVAQVESLPDPLPIERVEFAAKRQLPQPGEKAWILWTNISDDYCREWLDRAKASASSWQVVHEGPGRGLAIAQY